MGLVPDARAVLLVGDLARQIRSQALEIPDRAFERSDLARLLGDLEPLRAHRGITCLHRVPQHPMFDRFPQVAPHAVISLRPATGSESCESPRWHPCGPACGLTCNLH